MSAERSQVRVASEGSVRGGRAGVTATTTANMPGAGSYIVTSAIIVAIVIIIGGGRAELVEAGELLILAVTNMTNCVIFTSPVTTSTATIAINVLNAATHRRSLCLHVDYSRAANTVVTQACVFGQEDVDFASVIELRHLQTV